VTWSGVRVLTNDQYPHIVERLGECAQDGGAGWRPGALGSTFGSQEFTDSGQVLALIG
jgi:hypothetical protein